MDLLERGLRSAEERAREARLRAEAAEESGRRERAMETEQRATQVCVCVQHIS